MEISVNPNEVRAGAQGRVVVPAALRKAMNLKPGERLAARVGGNRLLLPGHGIRFAGNDRRPRLAAIASGTGCPADSLIHETLLSAIW